MAATQPESVKTKSSWTSTYTILIFAACACIYLQFVPKWLGRSDLDFLKVVATPLTVTLASLVGVLRRLEEGTLTRGLLLTSLAMFALIGGLLAFTLHDDLVRLGHQLFGV